MRFLLPIGLLLLLPCLSFAATINVPADQTTVGAALNAAVDGDTILIAPGVHDGGVLVDKSVTLASWFLASGDTAYVAQTVIRGTLGVTCEGDTICPGGAVLDFAPGSGGSVVTGLTLTNGVDGINSRVILEISYCRIIGNGDGVDFQGGSGGTFRNSLFANNTDDGIDLNGRINASIRDNIIRDNHEDGVEFRLYPYTGLRTNVDFIGNRITGNGSDGIQLIDYPGVTDRVIRIERNVFSGNADAAVGCLADGRTDEDFSGAPIAERVLLIHNTFAGERYGLVGGANVVALNNIFTGTQASALRRVGGTSIVSHCLFWNNGVNFDDIDEGRNIDLPHILYADPLLNAGYALTTGSPAIDAGTAFFEYQGEAVLDMSPSSYLGSAPDMGVFEFDDGQPPNAAPGVDAGADQSITLPADALLDGTVSDDGLPAPPGLLTTTWSVAGPGAVTFQDANEIDTRATFTTAGTYILSLTSYDGVLSATDQVTITVLQHPDSSLVGNPSFEVGASGWIGLTNTTLSRVEGGLDGGYAAQLTGTSATTGSFGLNDSPNWVRNTTAAGIRYRFTAWVRSMNSSGTARIHIREYLMSNGALQGQIMSTGVQLSPQWQMLTVEYATRSAGTTLDAGVKDFPLVAGEVFLVDNVSVHKVGTVTAVEVQGPPPGRSSVRRIYPTPTRDLIHVEARGPVNGSASIRIVQANGRIVRERRYSGLAPGQYQTFTMDTSGLPSGVYFLWYQSPNERGVGKKIILLK